LPLLAIEALVRGVLTHLQARKLDRAAAVYAVGGWLLVQVASITLPTFGAPEWTLRAFIALAVVGFPLTLAIAWVVAPHPSAAGAVSPKTGITDIALLAAVGTVIVLILAQAGYAFLRPSSAIQRQRLLASSRAAPETPPQGSVAVLPFVNMSGDPAKEYFSDGISEELLSDLSNDPRLRVAARTSSFAFKGKNEDIETIANALRVRRGRGKRPRSRQSRAHHRAADQRERRLSPLVGDLRPRPFRHPLGPG
jgi:hypothetical protein